MTLTRRSLLASASSTLLLAAPKPLKDRLGIFCGLAPEENAARKTLAAARAAGFARVQIQFPFSRVDDAYCRALPGWVKSEGLVCDVLGAYINCLEPSNVLMDARAEDLPRAISLGAELGAKALIAWTGTFGQGLMSFDKRNLDTDNLDKIRSFLEPHTKALKEARLSIALETYITLACPDANMLFDLLKKMPSCFGAVLDPPNMTPLAGFEKRDEVMRYMVSLLKDRIRVIHLKDFKLAADQRSYELPGPLDGVMNYPLYLELIRGLKSDAPIIAEHVGPERYTEVRTRLMPLL